MQNNYGDAMLLKLESPISHDVTSSDEVSWQCCCEPASPSLSLILVGSNAIKETLSE